jgi:hypothetical protein
MLFPSLCRAIQAIRGRRGVSDCKPFAFATITNCPRVKVWLGPLHHFPHRTSVLIASCLWGHSDRGAMHNSFIRAATRIQLTMQAFLISEPCLPLDPQFV